MVLLLLLMGLRGFVYLCVTPPLVGWDEYQHLAYVDALDETGRVPVLGETNVRPGLLDRLVEVPHHRFVLLQIGRFGAIDFDAYWNFRSGQSPKPVRKPGTLGLYEAQHGPLYYRLSVPFYRIFGGTRDLRSSTSALRLFNLALLIAAAGVVFWGLRRIVNNERTAALAALLVATQPLFLINGVRVANDALGVFLASIVIVLCLTSPRGWSIQRGAFLGIVIGLAVLAKAINFALLPFVAVCWTAVIVRGVESRRRSIIAAVACLVLFSILVQSEVRGNLSRFGGPTAMQEAAKNRRDGIDTHKLVLAARSIDWPKQLETLWLRESLFVCGWGFIKPSPKIIRLYEIALISGLSGWIVGTIRRLIRRVRALPSQVPALSPFAAIACVALVASFVLALGYHALQSQTAWGYSTTNPWYACAVYPWFLLLVLVGAGGWFGGLARGFIGVFLMGVFIASEATVVLGRLPLTFTSGAGGWEGLTRLAELQPSWLGTPTLLCAVTGTIVILAIAIQQILFLGVEKKPTTRVASRGDSAGSPNQSPRRTRARSASHARSTLLWCLVCFAIIQLCLGTLLRSKPLLADREFGQKLALLEKAIRVHSRHPLVLALGSSRMATGFRPQTFRSGAESTAKGPEEPLVFNFALVGSGPEMMHLTLKRLLDRGVRPERVLIEFWPPFWSIKRGIKDYQLQTDIGSLSYAQAKLLSRYVRKPDRLMNLWVRSQALASYVNRYSLLNALSPGWFPPPVERELRFEFVQADGWWKPHDSIDSDKSEWLVARYRDHYSPLLKNLSFQPSSIRAMHELLALCRRERIEAEVVVLPEGTDFRSWYPEPASKLIKSYLDDLARNERVPVIDARDWVEDKGFMDAHHLLPPGATSFTQRLGTEAFEPVLTGRSRSSTDQLTRGTRPLDAVRRR